MEWKSILVGFILGALIAIPIGMAHTGTFNNERSFWRGPGPMMGMGHGMGMMGYGMHGMMDDEMYAQMQNYMASGNFTEIHEKMEGQMEPYMAQYMGGDWAEMHETCEKYMGIEESDE